MKTFCRLAAIGLAQASASAAADAQAPARQFTVTPRGGLMTFEKATGLKTAPAFGLDATYNITPMFGVGVGLGFARAETRGEYFISALTFADTTFLTEVRQPVSLFNTSVNGTVRIPFEMLAPYLTGGIGTYTLHMDPQTTIGNSRVTRMSANLGGGLNYQLADRVGVSFDVRDLIFTKYQRSRLNPIGSLEINNRFQEDFPIPPANKETAHNFMFTLGFTFAPAGRGTTGDTGSEER